MIIKELISKFGFEVDHAPLEKVEHQLDQIKERLEFLAAAEVIKGIYELTERFAHFAEELHVAAISAGLTVEAFQKLSFAAGQSAVSQEELGGSLARLGRALYQARTGSEEAQKAFIQAGITPEQLHGFKNAGEAMGALADRFKAIDDPIQKSALAMQLMGRGSVNMVGFLSQGSAAIKGLGTEAEKFGIILSHQQVEALVKVEHSMNELWSIFKALGATIASYFAPSIETAIHDFIKFYEINKKLIETNVRAWVWDITFALGFVWEAVKTVTQAFFNFAAAHQTLVRRVSEFAVALIVLVGILWTAQKALSILKGSLRLVQTALSPLAFLWEKAFWPAIMWIGTLVRGVLSGLLLKLATLFETVLPAVAEGFLALGAAIEATPVGWLVTAITALVVILHDAWTLLSGGKWEDTWIAKAINAVKGFGGKALSFLGLSGNDETATNSAAKSLEEAQGLPAVPGGKPSAATAPGSGSSFSFGDMFSRAKNLFEVPAALGAQPTNPGGSQTAVMAGGTNVEINAPVTITVPAGSDPKMVGDKVKEGITDHLNGVYRRAQQSLRPAQSY